MNNLYYDVTMRCRQFQVGKKEIALLMGLKYPTFQRKLRENSFTDEQKAYLLETLELEGNTY